MKLNFKKISTVLLTTAASACFAFGVSAMTPTTEMASAEDTTTLATTKFSVSTNSENIILVTPLVGDVSDIYEVGYTFEGAQPTTVQANTSLYYTVLKTQSKEFTAKTLFGEEFTDTTPMIIWEIENDEDATYTATAYYKEGTRAEDGYLYADYNGIPDEAVVGGEKILKATSTITIKYLDGTKDVITNNPNAGGLSADPSKGYDYNSYNGVKMQAYVGGKAVTVTEEYLLGLTEDTVITYSEIKTGMKVLGYNASTNRLEATTAISDAYSEVTMSDTVSGDFEISFDVKWTSGTDWPVEAIGIEDSDGDSIQFIAGRIYVGCQGSWSAWTKMGESDGNSNVQWCRAAKGWSWANDRFGTENAEGGYDFTYKVIVDDGVAAMYIDDVYVQSFTLSKINSSFDLNDDLTVKFCVKYLHGSTPKTYLSNWTISDEILTAKKVTFNYIDGTTETIMNTSIPSKGYGYNSHNGIKMQGYVNGEKVTVTEKYLKSLTADTTISYSENRMGKKGLVYNPTENRLEATPATVGGLGEKSGYSQVQMSETVSGDFELTVTSWRRSANWPTIAFSVEDASGDTIQFIAGRVYVACQTGWSYANIAQTETANDYQKWLRNTNGWGSSMGVETSEYITFTFKVVVSGNIATSYVNDYKAYSFDLSKINSNFNVNDVLDVELCVRNMNLNAEGGYIRLTDWIINDK